MTIQEQARFLQSRQRQRFLHRQLSLLSRLSSELKTHIKGSQLRASYSTAMAQVPLSLEVREEEIIQKYQDNRYRGKPRYPLVRHLRGSQVRTTAYQPQTLSYHSSLRVSPHF